MGRPGMRGMLGMSVKSTSIPVPNRRRGEVDTVSHNIRVVWVGRDVKLLMKFSGITITRTLRGTLVPTHSSSTCFMRTDTLQASLVTSLLSGKANAQQGKI